jgi:hypothetical protein
MILIDTHQLDIAAMTLQSPANGLDRILDPLLHALVGARLVTTTIFTHNQSPKDFLSTTLYWTSEKISILLYGINPLNMPLELTRAVEW